VLYGTVALMPLFLVPLQVSGARKGFKAMIASVAASIVLVGAWQAIVLVRSGAVSPGTAAIGLSAPFAMILALLAMASPRLAGLSFTTRALLCALVASGLSLPTIFAALRDDRVRAMFVEAFDKAGGALGSGSIDAEALWGLVRVGIASSYGAVLFMFLFLSAWIGTRLVQRGLAARAVKAEAGSAPEGGAEGPDAYGAGDRPSLPPELRAYRVPGPFVWALLASWAGLLANRFFPSEVLSAVALNAALALSICYGVQGLAVAGALAERVGLATALRFLGPIALILLVASGVAGLAAIGVLALLGTLETWIPFRAVTKGDSP
jgi:hypothetical protein